MKTMTKCGLFLIGLVCIGFSSTATATLTLVDTYKDTPESTAHILAVANVRLGESNLINLLRLENQSPVPSGSPFTITYPTTNTAEVSWNLTGTGFDLLAVYIFGGSNGANLYKVTDSAQMISGSGTIHPPLTGNSGQFADISHTLFLGVAIPEPSSAILLAIGGGGFLAWRLRRR
jgi:hypothetical protein